MLYPHTKQSFCLGSHRSPLSEMGNTSTRAQEGSGDPSQIDERSFGSRSGDEHAERPEYHRRHTLSGAHGGSSHQRVKRVERSISMMERSSKTSQLPAEPHYISLSTDSSTKDDVGSHVQSTEPRGIADVSSTIVIQFDGDIRTIQEDKLLEVLFKYSSVIALF